MRDTEVVDAFIEHLRGSRCTGLTLACRPDEMNRNTKDIDAIAGDFAIEHTSVDSVPNQRKHDSQFESVVADLVRSHRSLMKFRLQIVFDYYAVGVGQDWAALRRGLNDWITEEAPQLKDGRYPQMEIRDVPFPVYVEKRSSRRPTLILGRDAPSDDTFIRRLGDAIARKVEKLKRYRGQYTALLLIESSDIALMNAAILEAAIAALDRDGQLGGVDEIWFADTSIPGALEFAELWSNGANA